MNSVLAKVNIWFKQNKLNLNPSKTRCMIFNAKTEEENLITIDNTVIERVWNKGKETSFKLVGIHIDEKQETTLQWLNHLTHYLRTRYLGAGNPRLTGQNLSQTKKGNT